MAVIVIVLAIVVAAPEYAEPAAGAELAPVESSEPSPDASAGPITVMEVLPTSDPPNKLKGYRWPVRGGMIAKYYDHDRDGRFVIDGERTHTGLVITWFEGAAVKAAHKGTVLSVGRDWAAYLGYDGSLDKHYERLARKKQKDSLGIVIDDGNGYYSVYTEIKDARVRAGDKVKGGQIIAGMSRAEKRQMMRYRLVRSDGVLMKVHASDRKLGYPDYAVEQVDPLAVFRLEAGKKPDIEKRRPPANPPRLSDY
jgi:co-chaperonin GroES (HSP10)